MITYIKTKKKVPVDTCSKILGFSFIRPYVFFICAIISYEPLLGQWVNIFPPCFSLFLPLYSLKGCGLIVSHF
jgi:hypothetical protein